METFSDIINKTINDISNPVDVPVPDQKTEKLDKIGQFNKEMEESEKELDELFDLMAKRRKLLTPTTK